MNMVIDIDKNLNVPVYPCEDERSLRDYAKDVNAYLIQADENINTLAADALMQRKYISSLEERLTVLLSKLEIPNV